MGECIGMDVLMNKQFLQYNYISRESSFPIYYHKLDDKWIYGLTKQLSTATSYVLHNIKDYDTLDSLALKYYGRPDLFWVLADFNRILDPFIKLYPKYKTLKIPSISTIEYMR